MLKLYSSIHDLTLPPTRGNRWSIFLSLRIFAHFPTRFLLSKPATHFRSKIGLHCPFHSGKTDLESQTQRQKVSKISSSRLVKFLTSKDQKLYFYLEKLLTKPDTTNNKQFVQINNLANLATMTPKISFENMLLASNFVHKFA